MSESRSFSLVGSSDCEEFRSGQKLQKSHFESAAYANFATPAEFNFNSLPRPILKPIGVVAYQKSVRLVQGAQRFKVRNLLERKRAKSAVSVVAKTATAPASRHLARSQMTLERSVKGGFRLVTERVSNLSYRHASFGQPRSGGVHLSSCDVLDGRLPNQFRKARRECGKGH